MEHSINHPTRVPYTAKCYKNYYKVLSVNKDVLVSVLFVDAHLLCPLNPTVLHCDMLQHSVIYCIYDITDM